MNKKLIVFDGADNTGKTTTISKLKCIYKNNDNISFLFFPSADLVESSVFKTAIREKNSYSIKLFVNALMEETYTQISQSTAKYIIIDRLIISTLIYQGLSEDLIYYIIDQYKRLFFRLHITEIHNICLLGHIASDKLETSNIKREIDNNDFYKNNVTDILPLLYKNSNIDMFDNIYCYKVNMNNISFVRENIFNLINIIIGQPLITSTRLNT